LILLFDEVHKQDGLVELKMQDSKIKNNTGLSPDQKMHDKI
jgi:hypothetical protein